MFRIAAALLLTLVATLAHAEQVVPLTIGGTEVRIAMQDGYLRASEKAPALFATSAAALPPAIRLVEAVLAESDLKRMLAGQGMALPYLQVQAVRDAEALDFSLEDWRTLQPMMARQLGAIDLDAQTQAMQSGMGERMGKASGGAVEIKFGEIGKPVVYSQAGDVIRYVMRLPINATVHGQDVKMVLDCAGAALVLNGKLLMINTYLRQDGKDDGSERIRAFLDVVVERAQALNVQEALGKTAGSNARYVIVAADPGFVGSSFVQGKHSTTMPAGEAFVSMSIPEQEFPYGYEGKGFLEIRHASR